MPKCACLNCGKVRNVVPADIANGKGKFCSMACKQEMCGFRRQVRAALPDTAAGIAERIGIDPAVVRRQLTRLQQMGEAHASRLVPLPAKATRGGNNSAIWYEAGRGDDPAVPHEPRPAHVYLARREILAAMPATMVELIERTSASSCSMSRILRQLHGERRCHIGGWKKGGSGIPTPVYYAGDGTDHNCGLKRLTKAQANKRYKKNLIRRGLYADYLQRNAAQQRAATLRKRGDPLVNALFGKRTADAARGDDGR